MSERHTVTPSFVDAILEARVLPAIQQVLPFSVLQGGGLVANLAFASSSVNTITSTGSNAGLGVGFNSQFSAGYAINAGMGEGPGGFVGGASLLSPGASSLAAILGGPSLNPFGVSLGSSASLVSGPGAGNSGGGGGVGFGGESGASPGPNPGGPRPVQVRPLPTGILQLIPPPDNNPPPDESTQPPAPKPGRDSTAPQSPNTAPTPFRTTPPNQPTGTVMLTTPP